MKGKVIFADQPTPIEKQQPTKITLSEEEYKDILKDAYKEGAKDALHETKQEGLKPTLSNVASIEKEESWQKNLSPEQKKGAKEGEREAAKIEAQKREQTKQKLEAIAERHDIVLLKAKTLFPFSIFPDTIIIDTTKLTIVRKQMFATEHITTIPLKDIADATVQTALFLATLTVKYMPQSNSPGMLSPVEDHITSLPREDALRAKNIIKGMLVASSENIDISQLKPEEIVNIVEKFGHSEGVA